MQHHDPHRTATIAAAALAGTLCLSAGAVAASPSTAPEPPEVVVSGLTNPRGFTWSDDGALIIALAGNGGEQEGVLSAGPSTIFGGRTSSIVRIEDGCPVVVAAWTDGSSLVVHVAEDGTVTDVWTGLTAVTDVVLGPDGALYAAEMATDNTTNIRPDTGRVVRQDGMDGLEVIADGLDFPSYLGVAPDGSLLVGSPAIGADDGQGTIARISRGAESGSNPRPAPMCVPAAS